MTNQELFDTVVRHLHQQEIPAISDLNCRYRTTDGRKCAIGCLIPDDKYTPDLEGVSLDELGPSDIDDLPQRQARVMAAAGLTEEQRPLGWALQTAHDEWGLYCLGKARLVQSLNQVAHDYQLSPAVVQELFSIGEAK